MYGGAVIIGARANFSNRTPSKTTDCVLCREWSLNHEKTALNFLRPKTIVNQDQRYTTMFSK